MENLSKKHGESATRYHQSVKWPVVFLYPFVRKGGVAVTVKVKTNFRDRESNLKLRKTGEQFEVSRKRSDKLAGLDLVEIVTEKPEKKG